MEQIIKKITQLNWIKWLPIVSNVFFIILFYFKLKEYLSKKHIGTYFGDPLSWYDFFANTIEFTLMVSIFCSFFIKNKWLKWVSVVTGLITFIIIFKNVSKFNPY